jgi:hypothetical protein
MPDVIRHAQVRQAGRKENMDSPHLTSEERLDFLLDQIAPEARPDLYRHLWGCAECSREVLAVLGEVSLDHDLVSQYLGESLWAESAEGPAERRKTLRESLTIGLSCGTPQDASGISDHRTVGGSCGVHADFRQCGPLAQAFSRPGRGDG